MVTTITYDVEHAVFGVPLLGRITLARATDALFADLILNVGTIPTLTTFIVQRNRYPYSCEPDPNLGSKKKWDDYYVDPSPIYQLSFRDEASISLARLTCAFLTLAAFSVFALVSFLIKLQLNRGGGIWSFCLTGYIRDF